MNETQRRPRHGERREQILDVALRLFAEHGSGSVTTRQIAEAVGISQPSLYAHFASADDIAEELCIRAFSALHDHFAQTLAQVSDPWERLDLLGRTYIDFGLAHPDMYRIAFIPSRPHEAKPAMSFDLAQDDPGLAAGLRAFAALRDTIAEIRGREDPENAVIAQAIWASVHGLTSLLITKPFFPWADREALIAMQIRQCRALLLPLPS